MRTPTYHVEAGVSAVGTAFQRNPASFDYFVIAEPVLTAAKTALAKQTPAVSLFEVAAFRTNGRKLTTRRRFRPQPYSSIRRPIPKRKAPSILFIKETAKPSG
jgi:hypothetical protein